MVAYYIVRVNKVQNSNGTCKRRLCFSNLVTFKSRSRVQSKSRKFRTRCTSHYKDYQAAVETPLFFRTRRRAMCALLFSRLMSAMPRVAPRRDHTQRALGEQRGYNDEASCGTS